jgi:uncharacterized protein (TIGR00369 family)
MNLREHVDRWLAGVELPPPIARTLGIRLLAVSEGEASTELPVAPALWNAMGTLHGGVFADLADVTMGVALATVAGERESFSTTQLSVAFFAPVREGLLRAHASVLRRGQTSGYADCTIETEAGVLVAKASCLCAFRSQA